jgi:hypothetical protein
VTVTEEALREAAGDDEGANGIVDLWLQVKREVDEAARCLDWGHDEITAAQVRHPQHADLLWHAWRIILPPQVFPVTEFVWRGHMREMLERVAAGEDTRPGTWAEVCMVCSEASALAPLTHSAAGLYFRAWHYAFPANPVWDTMPEEVAHGVKWDDYEITGMYRDLTGKIGRRNPNRRIARDTVCDGQHSGARVNCRFIPGTLDGSPDTRPAPARTRKPPRGKPAATAADAGLRAVSLDRVRQAADGLPRDMIAEIRAAFPRPDTDPDTLF